jgi:hypothetical protein
MRRISANLVKNTTVQKSIAMAAANVVNAAARIDGPI